MKLELKLSLLKNYVFGFFRHERREDQLKLRVLNHRLIGLIEHDLKILGFLFDFIALCLSEKTSWGLGDV